MEDLGLGFNHGVLLVGRYFLCWFELTSKYLIFPSYVWNTQFFFLSFSVMSFFPHFLKQASLSPKAEKVLEDTIQENTKGDVIYFWGHLDMDGVMESNDVLTFWSKCDILNGGNCRHVMSISCNVIVLYR
jgi:hypothetical protein